MICKWVYNMFYPFECRCWCALLTCEIKYRLENRFNVVQPFWCIQWNSYECICISYLHNSLRDFKNTTPTLWKPTVVYNFRLYHNFHQFQRVRDRNAHLRVKKSLQILLIVCQTKYVLSQIPINSSLLFNF